MEILTYIILFLAGVGAGIMNTVGGGGSVLTIPALIYLGGLPSTAANATNRIGLVAQNTMAIWRFRQGGIREDRAAWRLTLAGLPGALIGAQLASWIPDRQFDIVLGIILLVLLIPILLRPKPHLARDGEEVDAWGILNPRGKVASIVIFFFIGLYMGFLQAGAGIMILVALGYLMRINLVRANYIKLVIILVTNVLALGVFLWNQLGIDWFAGIAVFAGQILGAYAGSWVALRMGEKWIMIILSVCIVLSSAKLLGILDAAWALIH